MTCNVGNMDRLARLCAGVGLFLSPFVNEVVLWDSAWLRYGVALIGLALAGTSALRVCPPYRLLGLNTCRVLSRALPDKGPCNGPQENLCRTFGR